MQELPTSWKLALLEQAFGEGGCKRTWNWQLQESVKDLQTSILKNRDSEYGGERLSLRKAAIEGEDSMYHSSHAIDEIDRALAH